MHVPINDPHDIQMAIRELVDEVKNLKNRSTEPKGLATTAELDDLRKEMRRATQRPQTLDFQDEMRGAGGAHSIGHVPDPGPYFPTPSPLRPAPLYNGGDLQVLHEDGVWKFVLDGLIRAVPRGTGGTSKAQRIVNVLASMSVLNAFSADTIYAREINAERMNAKIPACTIKALADQSIPDNTPTAVNFDSEEDDNDNLHDLVVNNTRITFSRAGRWNFGGQARLAGYTTGPWRMRIRLGSGPNIGIASHEGTSTVFQELVIASSRRFIVGDYIEMVLLQTSGGPLNCTFVNAVSPIMWTEWVGP